MTGRDEALAPWPRSEEVVREHLHDYYACISSIDHHIGRIVDAIDDLGVLDNTLIYYIIGDNGASAEGSLQGTFNEMITLQGFGIDNAEPAPLSSRTVQLAWRNGRLTSRFCGFMRSEFFPSIASPR